MENWFRLDSISKKYHHHRNFLIPYINVGLNFPSHLSNLEKEKPWEIYHAINFELRVNIPENNLQYYISFFRTTKKKVLDVTAFPTYTTAFLSARLTKSISSTLVIYLSTNNQNGSSLDKYHMPGQYLIHPSPNFDSYGGLSPVRPSAKFIPPYVKRKLFSFNNTLTMHKKKILKFMIHFHQDFKLM